MTLQDDISLMASLRATMDAATEQLREWRARADEALAGLERANQRIADLEREVEELRCGDLVEFSDGELTPVRADKFRQHLGRCKACQDGLVANAELDARLSMFALPRGGG